ncbi:MAG: hypothetical protein VX589_18840 [Myxococcota bacterium]|nr:hypothetical protein [Myxococcota bacterium]
MRMVKTIFCFTALLPVMVSYAQPKPLSLDALAPYERTHVARAATEQRLTLDVDYTGQAIQFVRIYRYDVFVDFEPMPTMLNTLHARSTENLVKRELLVRAGDPFDQKKIAESVRNLRRLGIFSLVAAAAVYDRSTDSFGLLVVTRDLWSLRLESNFQFTGSNIDRLNAQLTERNLFGLGKVALIRYGLLPLEYSTGALYLDPRMGTQRLRLQLSGDLTFRRSTNEYNGFQTTVGLSRPFYDLGQRFGFNTFVNMVKRGQQIEEAGVVQGLPYRTHDGMIRIPMRWNYRSLNTEGTVRVQSGLAYIARFGVGVGFRNFSAEVPSDLALEQYDEVIQRHFVDTIVPNKNRWVYPVLSATFFENRYRVVRNLGGFALSEDVPLGPFLFLSLRQPIEALGSTEDLVVYSSHLVWRELYLDDGLVELGTATDGWYRVSEQNLDNQSILVRLRLASPSLRIGRFVSRSDWLSYLAPESAIQVSLGGDNGLRGYPSKAFAALGGSRLRSNFEYRTRPIAWAHLRFGMVAFYDAGLLYGGSNETGLRQSIGTGVRMVIPPASRLAYRLDFGVPVDGSGFFISISGETNQAVPILPYEDRVYDGLFSVGGLVNQP